jgi:CubicO group peptidase (beta-lactamase class C family)
MKSLPVVVIVAMGCLANVAWAAAPAANQPNVSESQTLRQQVNRALESALAEHRIVGAVVLISRDGRMVYQRAIGMADREKRRPMTVNTIFRLSSVTKPIVSVAALKLIEQGKLSLNDPVSKWLPRFLPRLPNADVPEITIRELLTHTAGLGYKFQEKAGGPYHRANISDGFDDVRVGLDENLQHLANVLLLSEPGTEWRYSLSIDVLGAVIEKVSGQPLPSAIAELVTRPLGMRDTAFSVKQADRLAVPYYNADPAPKPMADPQAIPFGDGELVYSPSRALEAQPYPSGGAGMVGTAPDILRLLESVRKGGAPVLNESSAKSMMMNQIGKLPGPMPGTQFGFGGAVVTNPAEAQAPYSPGTWTWGGIYGHTWFVDPAQNLTVVLLTNTALEGMMGKLTVDLRNAVYAAAK